MLLLVIFHVLRESKSLITAGKAPDALKLLMSSPVTLPSSTLTPSHEATSVSVNQVPLLDLDQFSPSNVL